MVYSTVSVYGTWYIARLVCMVVYSTVSVYGTWWYISYSYWRSNDVGGVRVVVVVEFE